MFEFKPLSREGIEPALAKAEHYRLLNQPWEAESICRDVLAIDPDNQTALVVLINALTEQFGDEGGVEEDEPKALLGRLSDERLQDYYAGMIAERRANELLAHGTLGTGPVVFELLREAMDYYEKAEAASPPGDDDALLRWNTCARIILRHRLRPPPKPPGTI